MADSSTADLSKGKRITGGDRTTLADELRQRYDGGESIRSLATLDQPFLRLRAPAAVRVRRHAARAGRREPERQEGRVSSSLPGEPRGWVRTTRDGVVLTVTLDRAEQLNAQTPATWEALRAVGDSLDDEVRVVVVQGAGRSFSAGLDRSLFTAAPDVPGGLGELATLPPELAQERIRGYQAAFRWLRAPGVVSIAAVQGHAIGAGAQLALACDLRVVTEDAQLQMREVSLGLVPDLTGTSTLVELVGYSRALEMCLTGRPIGAPEAVAIGLATVAVAPGRLADTVRDLVQALVATDVGASRETLALVRSAVRNDPDTQDAAERAAQVRRLHALAAPGR